MFFFCFVLMFKTYRKETVSGRRAHSGDWTCTPFSWVSPMMKSINGVAHSQKTYRCRCESPRRSAMETPVQCSASIVES
jgi:hypothetical protein